MFKNTLFWPSFSVNTFKQTMNQNDMTKRFQKKNFFWWQCLSSHYYYKKMEIKNYFQMSLSADCPLATVSYTLKFHQNTNLEDSCKTVIAVLDKGFSLEALSHPWALYITGLVPWRWLTTKWPSPFDFRMNIWCSKIKIF